MTFPEFVEWLAYFRAESAPAQSAGPSSGGDWRKQMAMLRELTGSRGRR